MGDYKPGPLPPYNEKLVGNLGASAFLKLFTYHLPTVQGVLAVLTPTMFLAATDTLYGCTWKLMSLKVC